MSHIDSRIVRPLSDSVSLWTQTVTSANRQFNSDCDEGDICMRDSASALRPSAKLRGLGRGVSVSLFLHATILVILAAVFLKPTDFDPPVIVTIRHGDDQVEPIELSSLSIDTAEIASARDEPSAISTFELLPPGDGITGLTPGPPVNVERGIRVANAQNSTGIAEPFSRFSPAIADRLARHSAAKAGDLEIALIWEGRSDLDLHVQFRGRSRDVTRTICYFNKGTGATGFLDVDMNCDLPFSETPIEHIRWDNKSPPAGTYQIQVHGFRLRSANQKIPQQVAFHVEIKTPRNLMSHSGAVAQGEYFEVETLTVGLGADRSLVITSLPEQLFVAARRKLETGDLGQKQEAQRVFRNLERKYPGSKIAIEARRLLERSN